MDGVYVGGGGCSGRATSVLSLSVQEDADKEGGVGRRLGDRGSACFSEVSTETWCSSDVVSLVGIGSGSEE